jgi:hypothetical protein
VNNFRGIKASTFDKVLPPRALPERVGMISSGNPDVLKSAADLKRKRGGRVMKIDGVRTKHRLDRPSRHDATGSAALRRSVAAAAIDKDAGGGSAARRKFADGGDASPGDIPRSGVDALMNSPKVRAIAAGLAGIQKASQAISRETGTQPAYRRGGGAR